MLENKASGLVRLLLKIVRKDAIVLGGKAYYLESPESYSLHLRLHEARHSHQQQDKLFYFKYALELLTKGYNNNKYEIDAEAWARMKLAEKSLYVQTYIMSDTEYLMKCYQEG